MFKATVAVISDSHFCEHSRFQECIRLHDWIARDVAERNPHVILLGGDLYERASTPNERRAAFWWLGRMASIAPVVIVRGNHDAIHDCELLSSLRTGCGIIVEEACGVHVVAGVAIACLAWPRKGELVARAPGVDASDALRAVLSGMRAQVEEHAGPRVLLAHAMVRGSVTSTGQPMVGCDMELGLEDLALAGADFVALGHIHKHQAWEHGGVPVVYPGSPRRTSFGESESKGYVVAEVERGEASWEFVEAPATLMVDVEAEWAGDARGMVFHGNVPDVQGSEVRFRYHVDSDKRDAARVAATKWADQFRAEGAVLVQVEEQVATTVRARAPEVAAARTTADKLEALWASRGFDPGERRPRIMGRLSEIEEVR
jgi:exonuclease SbcD